MAFGAISLSLFTPTTISLVLNSVSSTGEIKRAIRPLRHVGIQSMKRLPDRSEQIRRYSLSLSENISIGAAANYFHHRLASSLRRKVQPLQQWAPPFAFFFPPFPQVIHFQEMCNNTDLNAAHLFGFYPTIRNKPKKKNPCFAPRPLYFSV